MICIDNLHKRFGVHEVLKGINLRLDKPGIYGLLGPNGSGKSTLIKCLLGMVVPDQGTLQVFGKNCKGQWRYKDHIGYLPQHARFPQNLNLQELCAMVVDIRNRKAKHTDKLIELFELTPHLKKNVKQLSGGTLQKVNLLLCLMFNNPIVILDEPSTGLDPLALLQLKKWLTDNSESIILITSHITHFVESLCEKVFFLAEGRILLETEASNLDQKILDLYV
ncbi:MAG: ABC transporter ATP-binding protein [Flavobacteriaceae bacterium]